MEDLGWDDYALMMAIVRVVRSRWVSILIFDVGRENFIGMALDCVEVHYGFEKRQVCLTPPEVHVWRMDTNVCHPWEDQSVNLPVPFALPSAKVFIQPLQAALVL